MITKKFCPVCGSDDVEMVAAGTTGTWMCRNCGFSGSVFPEKPIVGKDGGIGDGKITDMKKSLKKKGGKK